MIRLRRAIVIALGDARPGAHELEVDVDGERATAIAYPDLCGPVTVGDVVILNTTAVSLGLGTGGVHFVVAVEGAQVGGDDAPGRVMKARYTPLADRRVERGGDPPRRASRARPGWSRRRSSARRCTRCSDRSPPAPSERATRASCTS